MTNQNTLLALGVSLNEQGIASEDVIARFLTVIDAPEASENTGALLGATRSAIRDPKSNYVVAPCGHSQVRFDQQDQCLSVLTGIGDLIG